MLLRGLLVIAGTLFLTILAIAPAHADDHDGDWVTISGTVWFDENVDGIRQPSEPVAAGVSVYKWVGPYALNASYTDEQGQYTFTVRAWRRRGMAGHFPGVGVRLRVYYLLPGDYTKKTRWGISHTGGFGFHYFIPVDYKVHPTVNEITVKKTSWGELYTHFGCGYVYVYPEDPEHTVDIRVVDHPDDGSIPPPDWPLAEGHFFKQTRNGYGCDAGYPVTNADGVPFWETWRELGLENVGYPTSDRYLWRGFITQTFQKAVFQWRPGKGVSLVNVFDELHNAGYDDELRERWATPQSLSPPFNSYLPVGKWEELDKELREQLREQILTHRLALLDANPAIKERYFSAPDPLWQYGLPTSKVVDYGNMFVIRTQKAVLQQWKEDVPWAKAGEVTIANGVDIAKAVSEVEKYDEVRGSFYYVYLFPPLGP